MAESKEGGQPIDREEIDQGSRVTQEGQPSGSAAATRAEQPSGSAATRLGQSDGAAAAQAEGHGASAGGHDGAAAAHAQAQPKKRRHWPIVVGVVLVVLVAAGAGFFVWHNQPSFCNAICHSPMDNYVNGYYEDSSLLANTHMKANVTCLECHEATISDQVNEACAYMSGDFSVDENGNILTVGVSADQSFCTNGACHNMDDVKAATANWGGEEGVNPHDSHQGTLYCSDCHSVHGTSNLYCNACHDWKVPDGWTSASKE